MFTSIITQADDRKPRREILRRTARLVLMEEMAGRHVIQRNIIEAKYAKLISYGAQVEWGRHFVAFPTRTGWGSLANWLPSETIPVGPAMLMSVEPVIIPVCYIAGFPSPWCLGPIFKSFAVIG